MSENVQILRLMHAKLFSKLSVTIGTSISIYTARPPHLSALSQQKRKEHVGTLVGGFHA